MKTENKITNLKTHTHKTLGFFRSRKRSAAIILLLLLAVLFLGYRKYTSTKNVPQYQTAKVEKETIVSSVSTSGQINNTNRIEISTQASGVVDKVLVSNGAIVTSGQEIAEITPDQATLQAQSQAWSAYLLAKTNLDAASAKAFSLRSTMDTAWKKFYDLATSSQYQNSDGSPRQDMRNSSAEFQSAEGDWLAGEANYKNQQAVINQTQAAVTSSWNSYQLVSTKITAPSAGTISNLSIVPDMVIASQSQSATTTTTAGKQKIVTIETGINTTIGTFNLSEIDAARVKEGMQATITIDALGDKIFTGKVMAIDKSGVVSSGVTNYPAIIEFDVGDASILPNMSATANIIVDTKSDVLTVPTSAVQTQGKQKLVRVLKSGQITQALVEIGESSDTATEVTSGLSEGDEVVTGQTSGQSQGSSGQSPFGIRFSPFGGGGNTGAGALRPGGAGARGQGQNR